MVLFGSLARNGCGRDVDIAVKGDFKSALDLGKIVVELEEELGISHDYIDVIDIDSAPIHLLKKIIDEGVIVYGDREEALKDLSHKYIEILDQLEEEKAVKTKLGKQFH